MAHRPKDCRIVATATSRQVQQIDRAADHLEVSRAEFIRQAAIRLSEEIESQSRQIAA